MQRRVTPDTVPLLTIHDVGKQFPGVQALQGVSFAVLPGEVHVLLGANGAGKSTLIKILAGYYHHDAGQIFFKQREVSFDSPAAAQRAGISVLYQEGSLVAHLTVAQNIYLGNEPRRIPGLPIIDHARMSEGAQALLDRFNLPIDPEALAGELSRAEQKMVEVARALHLSADLIIMDEPTATMNMREVSDLLAAIRALRAQGVAFMYVSHRLEEILPIGDQVTVLRDGRKVATVPLAETSLDALVEMISGYPLREPFLKTPAAPGAEILRVDYLKCQGVLSDISFSLYAGEILGFTGLTGSGGTMLAQALFGVSPIDAGTIAIDQRPASIRSPQDAIACGIGLLTERRLEQGLVLNMSAHDNMTLAALALVQHGPLIDHNAEHALVLQYATRLGLRRERLDQKALYLSSGTQQKLVLAKWLATHSRVLIFDEPTQGVDVSARAEIYRLIDELAHQGVGIIVISSNMTEILGICDRIMVLRQGRLVAELPREHATQSVLLAHAAGRGLSYG